MLSIKREPRNGGSTRSPQAQSAVPSRRHPAQGLPHSFPASDTLLLLSSPRPSPAHRADDGVPAIHGQTYDDGLSQLFCPTRLSRSSKVTLTSLVRTRPPSDP